MGLDAIAAKFRLLALLLLLAGVGHTDSIAQAARQDAALFPAAAVRFLDGELPLMEAAIKERDRDFFEESMARTVSFSEDWGFKARANPDLAPFQACTDAVSDYVVVGLCRLMPASSACDPALATHFDASVRSCRAAAR
ncbi:MAG: hypothetical protein JWQ41_2954 [Variovorax sp.]|nr:hypothetical protein [Variovorax sp.]